ncbi:ribonuclease III domain-containing protein [Xylaria palmicola]|nr:ribonuclease III domain-containing protein [Xylaria palmicola]
MSKRSFEEFSTVESSTRYRSILDHADNLLKAAQSLKQDLERLGNHNNSPSYESILSSLKHHNAHIHLATQALAQDETANSSEPPESAHKAQKVDQHNESSDSHPQPGLSIPHPALLTKWTPQDVPDRDVLPPMPPVLDPVLEKAARTHAGIAGGIGEMGYERLEWIGDAYLYLISSAFIYQTFPSLPAGRCSQLRERLIKNETLSDFSVRYGIDKRARLPTEYQPGGRPSTTGAGTSASKKERKKILGDLLEAYAAAAILGDTGGLPRVITWLKLLWGSNLKHEINDQHKKSISQGGPGSINGEGRPHKTTSSQPSPNVPAKAALLQAIGAKGVAVSYRDAGNPKKDRNSGLPWFTVGAYYNGLGETDLCLGYGSGLSKKDAGEKAALNALENKKLIKRLQKLKAEVNARLAGHNPPNATTTG